MWTMCYSVECVCCREVDEVVRKIEENDTEVDCITSHEGCVPESMGSSGSLFCLS